MSFASQISLIPFSALGTTMIFRNIRTDMMNIIMTIPFGFLLPLIWKEFRQIKKMALAGFLFSLTIELSQLLNRRLSAIDDLIMNTVGTIIGYMIFKVIYKIITKRSEAIPVAKVSSPIIRNEAVIYLVCAFLGVFLFYNSFYILKHDVYAVEGKPVNIEDTDIEHIPTGIIEEIYNDSIAVRRIELLDYNGNLQESNTGEIEPVILNNDTVVEIWRTDTTRSLEQIVTVGSRDALAVHDIIDVQGKQEQGNVVAEKIIIWKFDQ